MCPAFVGSRFFGASVFEALRVEEGIEFTSVVAPAADDRLALAARAAGLAVHVLENPKIVPADAIRMFLYAQSIAPASGSANLDAAKASVVRVICVRK